MMYDDDERSLPLIQSTWKMIKILIGIGLLLIILLSIGNSGTNIWSVFSTCACGLLLGGASFAGGGFMGFIFGIPSLLQNQNLTVAKPTTFKYNDNLVQISDWLTKIIVGVGLTQLGNIPKKVLRLGEILAPNFGGSPVGNNYALVIIFYFLLFGFLIIYFWTRTDFTNIMKKTDDDINQIRKQHNEFKKDVVQVEVKENIEKSDLASDTSSIHILEQNNPDFKEKLGLLKEKVRTVLSAKPKGKFADDLQKGRWGGNSVSDGKKIEATVTNSKWKDFYNVNISVSCVDGSCLREPVALFVHDTYKIPDNVIYVNPDSNGVARISLLAYEAFTIGALFQDDTELELDLNVQRGYPEDFYWKE